MSIVEKNNKINNNKYENFPIVIFSLFFSWILAFPFEGQVLYKLAEVHSIDPHAMIFEAIAAHFIGLSLSGFFITNMRCAKMLMLFSTIFCIFGTGIFLFPYSFLWNISLILISFFAGGFVVAWGYCIRRFSPKSERLNTVADVLIYSNILMIIINLCTVYISPYLGLFFSILMLVITLYFVIKLPSVGKVELIDKTEEFNKTPSVLKPLLFLCIFIVIITINSGFMYQVINPAYSHIEWLTSWYWAIPYIVALYIMRNLPRKTNRTFILFVAIAMIGFSFIIFVSFEHTAVSYLIVNTLMLGACGVFDLFWWSILAEMLDYVNNPAKIFGIGLSSNVLGVLIGGIIGNVVFAAETQILNASLLAMSVICISLVFLPILHKQLSLILSNHAYLTTISVTTKKEQVNAVESFVNLGNLTDRESEIALLLLKGNTYRMIAGELHISENTVKTHIKKIYSKFNIQSRTELINIMIEQKSYSIL